MKLRRPTIAVFALVALVLTATMRCMDRIEIRGAEMIEIHGAEMIKNHGAEMISMSKSSSKSLTTTATE